jgi:hypothetical protein
MDVVGANELPRRARSARRGSSFVRSGGGFSRSARKIFFQYFAFLRVETTIQADLNVDSKRTLKDASTAKVSGQNTQ